MTEPRRKIARINRCRFAIIMVGELSASGYDEIHATFIKRKDAEKVLREFVPSPRVRRMFYRIERLEEVKKNGRDKE